MKRIFSKMSMFSNDSNPNDTSYIKGYRLNYSDNEDSISNNSEVIQSIQDRSFHLDNSSRGVNANHKKMIEKQQKQPNVTCDNYQLADKCRISIECRNNQICIEGHSLKKRT